MLRMVNNPLSSGGTLCSDFRQITTVKLADDLSFIEIHTCVKQRTLEQEDFRV